MNRYCCALWWSVWVLAGSLAWGQQAKTERLEGAFTYQHFETSEDCGTCHGLLFRQHQQALMSQSFVHPWDEIEYFELALPHSKKEAKVAGIKAGCIGCHAPLAYLAGDIPPKRPSAGSRANEGVSCDLCHSMTGFKGDLPFNFNYVVSPGEIKQGVHDDSQSPSHDVKANLFLKSAEFCGTCHNEKDPFGVWVKSTHLEWKEGPYARAGVVCQNCHMPAAAGASAPGIGKERAEVRQHLFHGAHSPDKLRGSVEVRIYPESSRVAAGDTLELTVTVVNAKAGHMIPSGSAEERLLWLHVEAVDSAGHTYHLPVKPKGFEKEEYTIASSSAMAYQDIGDIQGLKDFPGLKRDGGVPEGDRIYRLPYFDSQGRMTIAQWNTASLGTDYRLAPLRAVNENFSWTLPASVPAGTLTVKAAVWYSRLVPSVAAFLKVPQEESRPFQVNSVSVAVQVGAEKAS